MKRFLDTIFAAVIAFAAVCCPSLHAETVFGQDFKLNNVAAYDESHIQLTSSDVTYGRGSAFLQAPMKLVPGESFEVRFAFRILGGTDGADGMTLAFQSAGPGFLGQAGGNLGFYSIAGGNGLPLPFGPAYGASIDTYKNAAYMDQGNNNIGFLDSSTYAARQSIAAPYDLNSGSEMLVWANYDGVANSMSVYMSDTPTKPSAPLAVDDIDLPAWLGNSTYVGFTAATGGLVNDHIVTTFSISPVPEPGSWSLLAAGLLAVAYVVRRRPARATAP